MADWPEEKKKTHQIKLQAGRLNCVTTCLNRNVLSQNGCSNLWRINEILGDLQLWGGLQRHAHRATQRHTQGAQAKPKHAGDPIDRNSLFTVRDEKAIFVRNLLTPVNFFGERALPLQVPLTRRRHARTHRSPNLQVVSCFSDSCTDFPNSVVAVPPHKGVKFD